MSDVRNGVKLASWLTVLALAAGCGTSVGKASAADCNQQRTVDGYAISLQLDPCPARGGTTANVTITMRDRSGNPVTDAKVTVLPDMPSMNMAGDTKTATADPTGYRTDVLLGMSGAWRINVTATPASGSPVKAHFSIWVD